MYDRTSLRDRATLYTGPAKRAPKSEPDAARDFRDFARIEQERAGHKTRWDEAYNLAMPDRAAFQMGKEPGQHKQNAVDSHGIYATRRGAGNICGALFPEEHKWANLIAGSDIPENQKDDVNAKMEDIRDTLFERIGVSAFYSEAHAAALDLMCSMLSMIVERGDWKKPLRCKAVPLPEVYPIAGIGGEITGAMRKYDCEVGLIEQEWSGYGVPVTLPDSLREKAAKDPKEKVCLLEVTRTLDSGFQRITVYVHESRHPIFDYMGSDPNEPSRWIIARLYRTSDEVYGRGPLLEALPSIRMLNIVKEIEAKTMKKRLDPPLFADTESDLNPQNIRLTPAAVNFYNGMKLQGRPPFFEAPVNGAAAQQGQISSEKLEEDIDRILFARSVLPPVQESHQMTAAEVMVRRQELLRDQGVDFGRIQREFLFGFISRALWVLQSFGPSMGIPPFVRIDGRRFKIEYAGPMAQAQKSADATNILAFVTNVTAAVGPEAAALGIKMDAVAHEVGERSGIPASILRTEAERQQLVQAAMQHAQEQQQMAMAGGPQPGQVPGA